MKTVAFYIPANLDLSLFSEMKIGLMEKHLFVINLVCFKSNFQEFSQNNEGFAFISFNELSTVLSDKEIRSIKTKLIDLGILEENRSYSVGNFPKSYRLTAQYAAAGCIKYFANSLTVVKNIAAMKNSKIDYQKNRPELNFQLKNLYNTEINLELIKNIVQSNSTLIYSATSNSLDINIIKYHQSINCIKKDNMIEDKSTLYVFPFSMQTNNINHFEESSSQNTYLPSELDFKNMVNFENATRFHEKDIYFTNNNASGRLYNSFTGIKRDYRQFIHEKGTDDVLDHLDLSNSQPFLLNYYLMQHYGVTPPKDVLDYINLTSTGQLYEYIQDEVNPSNLKRDDLKKSIMKDLFFKATHYSTELEKAFQMHFPSVYYLIQSMKQKDYRLFSIELQRLESKLFVHLIGDNLRKDNIYFLTVHDSVYFHSNDETIVRNAILSEFNKFALTPHLKR